MKKFLRILLCILGASVSCHSFANANTTFVGPYVKGSYNGTCCDITVFSFAGEAGPNHFRINGTLAWKLRENQRFKVSAEYLFQRINYSFFFANAKEWTNQGAIGASYEYFLYGLLYSPSLYLSGYLSHAPSNSLRTKTQDFLLDDDTFITVTDQRRIAGSDAGGFALGSALEPWCGGKASVELNYDDVRYDTIYSGNKNAMGFGGTLRFRQQILPEVNIGGLVAIRRPFNNFQAYLNYSIPYYGEWVLGLETSYVVGKNNLPDTWNIGLSFNYFLDQRSATCGGLSAMNFKGECMSEFMHQTPCDDFMQYVFEPAVYIPQVLAIPENRITVPGG